MSVPGHKLGCICEDCQDDVRLPMGLSEAEKVERFKLDRLMLAGFPIGYAVQIAHSDADWHKAADLLLQGCPAATATEILI